MWHKQSFTQFWSQSDAYSRRSSLKLTYIHHPLVVCTHQICCAVAVPIALSQDRLLHGHNRLVNWTPCSRRRESKLKNQMLNRTLLTSILYNYAKIHNSLSLVRETSIYQMDMYSQTILTGRSLIAQLCALALLYQSYNIQYLVQYLYRTQDEFT